MKPFLFTTRGVFGLWALSASSVLAQENALSILDSAQLAEKQGDFSAAFGYYERALAEYPGKEIEIRSTLQGYYEELGLSEEAAVNQMRLAELDSINSIQPTVEPVIEATGFYGSVRSGYQDWQQRRLLDSAHTRRGYVNLNLGYEWKWGEWLNDLSFGLWGTVENDAYQTYGKKFPASLGTWGWSPEISYALGKGAWSGYLSLQKEYSGLQSLSTSKNSTQTTSGIVADTTVTLSVNLSREVTAASGRIWVYGLDLYSVLEQTREISLGLRTRKRTDNLQISYDGSFGFTGDLYSNPGQTQYKLPTLLMDGHSIDTVETRLSLLPNDSINQKEIQFSQIFATMGVAPRYYGPWGLQAELSLRTSFYMEARKETYYLQDSQLYTGDLFLVRGQYYGRNDVDTTFRFVGLDKYSHRPAWLNLSVRPMLKWKLGSHATITTWYSFVTDLWREDYKLFPEGDASLDFNSQSWSLSASYTF